MVDQKPVTVRTIDEILDEMGRGFIEAWHQAENGDRIVDRKQVLVPIETLAAIATPQRIQLIRALRLNSECSIADLSTRLNRDQRGVYEDVSILLNLGLIQMENGMLCAPHGKIELSIE